jgi:hypothetical protein
MAPHSPVPSFVFAPFVDFFGSDLCLYLIKQKCPIFFFFFFFTGLSWHSHARTQKKMFSLSSHLFSPFPLSLLRRKPHRRPPRRVPPRALHCPHSRQRVESARVAAPQQVPGVAVQRRVCRRRGEKSADRVADGGEGPSRGPSCLEDVDADLSGPEVHVRVEDARGEADPRGSKRVGVRDEDRQLELGALVRGALGPAHKGRPGPEVGLVGEGEIDAVVVALVFGGVEAAGRGCTGVLFVFLRVFLRGRGRRGRAMVVVVVRA